jgi:hypothetical protein
VDPRWPTGSAPTTKGHDVTIEVLDPETGDNPLVERLPFAGITYDHKDDVVVVSVGGRSPRYPVVPSGT